MFKDPELLDVTRTPGPHLGFGHGPHQRAGVPFARMELQIALGALAGRSLGLRLAVPPGELRWTVGPALAALPVVW